MNVSFAIIQNADSVVPTETIAIENRKNYGGKRGRPNIKMPKNEASSMNAVNVS
jgi:hypothetical protein